jgi:assimilatory nitrate reductase catalytic subunit
VHYQSPAEEPDENYPFYLTTGRVLAHYQSGAQTRRVPRLQEMMPYPFVEIHPTTARRYGLEDGDAVTLVTRRGSASFKTRLTPGIRPDTLFVPFHWGGAQSVNRLTNPALDPISRMPEFKVCAVRIERSQEDTKRLSEKGCQRYSTLTRERSSRARPSLLSWSSTALG